MSSRTTCPAHCRDSQFISPGLRPAAWLRPARPPRKRCPHSPGGDIVDGGDVFRCVAIEDNVPNLALLVTGHIGVVAGKPALGVTQQHDRILLATEEVNALLRRKVGSARVKPHSHCTHSKAVHQLTPVSMPRGKLVDAEPLCGPVGINRFGKPCTSIPRKVDGPSFHFSENFAPPIPRISIWSYAPVMASKPVE